MRLHWYVGIVIANNNIDIGTIVAVKLSEYSIVSEYRNKFRALLYNTAASFYSISLKDEYEPFQDYEDYLIEDILQRSFSDGSLEKQDYALDFDLDELYVFWRDKK